jgi:hypothetical protein
MFFKLARCGYTLRVTSQTSYSPEYITPTQREKISIVLYIVTGPVDMSKVSILNGIDTVVVSQGVYYPLKIETRDKYENLCEFEYTEEMFEINIKQVY